MIDKGDDYYKVHKAYPMIVEEEWETFKNNILHLKGGQGFAGMGF
jgi:hypothetical protein